MKAASAWQCGQTVLEPTYPLFSGRPDRSAERRRRPVAPGRAAGLRRSGRSPGRGRRRGCQPSAPAAEQRRPGVAEGDAGGAGRLLRLLAGSAKGLSRQELTWLLSLACGDGPRSISARRVKVGTSAFFSTTFLNRSPCLTRREIGLTGFGASLYFATLQLDSMPCVR